jgi:mRNA interferase MazF
MLEPDPLVIFRGELWWANLPEPIGSEPGFRRPVLIVQINRFNQSRLATVVAVAVTTNLALAQMPGNVLIEAAASGLEQDSVVNITQVITIDRQFLLKRIGSLPQNLLQRVEQGLRLIQGL